MIRKIDESGAYMRGFREDIESAVARLKAAGYTGTIFYDSAAMNRARKNLKDVQRLFDVVSENRLAASDETPALCKEFETLTNDLLVTIHYILDSYEQD